MASSTTLLFELLKDCWGQLRHSTMIRNPVSERSSQHIDIREDNNIEDHKAHERRNWTVDLERIFVITNFIFELPSVVFDQLFLSINRFDLVLFTRVKGKMLHGSGALPWLYYPSPSDKLFGNFNDIVGLSPFVFYSNKL
ncbi:hypothetical protein CUMW_084460, partial [Citrus unshiu]